MTDIRTVFPIARKLNLPFTRDQAMLLLAAINLIFLGLDTYLAHLVSGTIVLREQIPIYFGFVSGFMLLFTGLIAKRNRNRAAQLAGIVFVTSVIVGLLGAYFHILRAILPFAPAGEKVTIHLLIWAPPVIAPLTFALVGIWGASAALLEKPINSGILFVGKTKNISLPYSKTRAYLMMLSMGILVTLISSALDHARDQYHNIWVWLPVAVGIFATVIPAALAMFDKPSKADVWVYVFAMILMIAVGAIGAVLHIQFDLTSTNTIVVERFIRGAPVLAPLLFANMGLFGLLVLLPTQKPEKSQASDS